MLLLFSKNSNKVNISSLYGFLCVLCFILHSFLSFLFLFIKITPLIFLNILSVLVYTLLFYYVRRNMYRFATIVCGIEITTNVFVSSILLGWSSGFYFYLLALIPLSFYCKFKFKQTKFFVSIWIFIVFLATYLFSHFTEQHYQINYNVMGILYITNALCCFIVLILISHLYTKTITFETNKLSEKNKNLQILANTDPLTGLLNRRSMLKKLDQAYSAFKNQKINFSVILTDIDNFKMLNDNFGHECGDLILKNICDIIRNTLRKDDIICRWGGEEILILLPATNISAAEHVAEKLRQTIEDFSIDNSGKKVSVTITSGVCCANEEFDVNALINCADKCMYKGKSMGKNRVVVKRR